ncbi:sialoadhesin [Osmerus eperlanus]|uniref:sialoadhesin n=1 Tax=Osmerus eperlanus TaxID=29151 RepID=UPI002E121343
MCLDRMLLVCTVIFAALWRDTHAFDPIPSIPERVSALVGSCVVIPCSFTRLSIHSVKSRHERVDVRVTYRDSSMSRIFSLRSIAFNSAEGNQVNSVFQGRTSLWGNLADGDCSVKIERVTMEDSLVYELALKKSGDLHWGKTRRVHLVVSSTPENPVISGVESVTEGQVVTVNCTVNYFCPSQPPTLKWNWERGAQENSSVPRRVEKLQAQKLMLLASLSFTATSHIKSRLRCEAVFPGDRRASVLKHFQVTFSPKDVEVQVLSLIIREGANILLTCVCKADPPVSNYNWSYTQHGYVVNLQKHTNTIRVYNVTRDMRFRCSAQNAVGRSESKPIDLDIHYKPFILHRSSSCVVKEFEVLCLCAVDSNPRPAVTWTVNGSLPPSSYNTSVISYNRTLVAVMRGPMVTPLRVVCVTTNSLGNDSHTLLEGGEGTSSLLWRVITAATISVPVFLLSMLLLCCCHRRVKKRVLSTRHPSVYPGEFDIYQDPIPLYINCTEVTHIYNNGSYQLVYQNCTPLFVRSKQKQHNSLCQTATREGERTAGERWGWRGESRRGGCRAFRGPRNPTSTDNETAIYLEII